MYELVAKSLWTLAMPSNFMAFILLAGLILLVLRRRWAPLFLTLGALMIAIGGLTPVGDWLMAPLENRFPSIAQKLPPHVDGIVILGGSEQPHLTYMRHQFTLNDHSERLIAGAMLARHYPNAKIVHTGGSGKRTEMLESGVAKAFFAGLGLTGARFIYEDRSVNTYENAVLAAKLAHPKSGETWLLVTSAFHMPRAVGAFRHAGWDITPYPVDYYTDGKAPYWHKLNVAGNLEKLDWGVHEWVGLAAYRILGKSSAFYPGP